MDVILLHHFFIFRVRPDHLCHVSKTHILSRLDTSHFPLALRDDRTDLLVDPRMHISNVSVSEADPQIVLVIEEGHLLPALLKHHFPLIAHVLELVHQLLVVEVVQYWRQQVEAAVTDQHRPARLPQLDLVFRLGRVKTVQEIVQLHCQTLGERGIPVVLDPRIFHKY